MDSIISNITTERIVIPCLTTKLTECKTVKIIEWFFKNQSKRRSEGKEKGTWIRWGKKEGN